MKPHIGRLQDAAPECRHDADLYKEGYRESFSDIGVSERDEWRKRSVRKRVRREDLALTRETLCRAKAMRVASVPDAEGQLSDAAARRPPAGGTAAANQSCCAHVAQSVAQWAASYAGACVGARVLLPPAHLAEAASDDALAALFLTLAHLFVDVHVAARMASQLVRSIPLTPDHAAALVTDGATRWRPVRVCGSQALRVWR